MNPANFECSICLGKGLKIDHTHNIVSLSDQGQIDQGLYNNYRSERALALCYQR